MPPLVGIGLHGLLRPYAGRVCVQPRPSTDAPDVLVLDPLGDVMEWRRFGDGVARVALSWDVSERAARRAQELGAISVVPYTIGAKELVLALETAYRAPRQAPEHRWSSVLADDAGDVSPSMLSQREYQVLTLIASGLTNDEIAADLFLSINSVKTYIRTAYRKIGVTRRAQAVLWAVDHGL